ncbi:hypothetical protein BIV57_07380 [Mangrovactinospora gilvigrisea]|uniref:Uncharacterized protein n=1 Tax=Mangrovactinospora gilvigrisea TaxID=1428644 RepID=A0A1J7BHF8_9ACTN|nr:hypothetical protein BIV57_07380 [Mangrovactinospora gilvigrisea]
MLLLTAGFVALGLLLGGHAHAAAPRAGATHGVPAVRTASDLAHTAAARTHSAVRHTAGSGPRRQAARIRSQLSGVHARGRATTDRAVRDVRTAGAAVGTAVHAVRGTLDRLPVRLPSPGGAAPRGPGRSRHLGPAQPAAAGHAAAAHRGTATTAARPGTGAATASDTGLPTAARPAVADGGTHAPAGPSQGADRTDQGLAAHPASGGAPGLPAASGPRLARQADAVRTPWHAPAPGRAADVTVRPG